MHSLCATAHSGLASSRLTDPARQHRCSTVVQLPAGSVRSRLGRHISVRSLTRQRLQQRRATEKEQEAGTAADGSSDDAGGSIENSSRAVAKAPVDPVRAAARVAEEAQVAQGQRTAVITGAVSIVFGVLYLVLVQFLDSRGGEMQPPPPEAFGL